MKIKKLSCENLQSALNEILYETFKNFMIEYNK